jgi:hypothetical protein
VPANADALEDALRDADGEADAPSAVRPADADAVGDVSAAGWDCSGPFGECPGEDVKTKPTAAETPSRAPMTHAIENRPQAVSVDP